MKHILVKTCFAHLYYTYMHCTHTG